MDIKVEKLEKSQIKLNINLSKEEFEDFYNKAFSQLNEKTEIKGFRKGKAPKEILEKTLGKERILVEAGDLAVQESLKMAVEKNDFEVISQPEVKINKIGLGEPMSFEALFTVLPEIKLPDYKKIASSIKKEKVEVSEKEIDGALKWVQRSRAKLSAKTGAAEIGDFVEIEYFSPDVHEISEEHKKKDAFILGEGHFFSGFEDVIKGMKSGEEKKNFELEIPKDHSFKKVAGKKIKFNLKLNSAQKVEFPEINDEFAKGLGKFENLEALKKNIKEGIISEKEYGALAKAREEAIGKIIEKTEVQIPKVLLEREPNEKKIKFYLVLREIAKKENKDYDKAYEIIDNLIK